jgi:hypothetical protein
MQARGGVSVVAALLACGALFASLSGCGGQTSQTGVSLGGAGTECKKSSEPQPTFPIEKPKDRALVNTALIDKLTGWRFVEEHQSFSSTDGAKRSAAELTGGGDQVQALYVEPATSQYAWNEFLWASPEWSERNASKPSWVSHTEPGAFEPPNQFAYFSQLGLSSQFGATQTNRVFEGTVSSGASRLSVYCVDRPSLALFKTGAAGHRRLRFVVDPAGYVAEWVLVSVGPKVAECQEVTLTIAPELTARGKHDDLPKSWMTELRFLKSCRAEYANAAAARPRSPRREIRKRSAVCGCRLRPSADLLHRR